MVERVLKNKKIHQLSNFKKEIASNSSLICKKVNPNHSKSIKIANPEHLHCEILGDELKEQQR